MLKKLLVIPWLAVVCAIAVASSGLRFDSDAWLSRDHPLEKQLDYLAEEFEEGESLLLIIPLKEGFFSAPSLFPAIDDLEKQLLKIPGVSASRSPLSAKTVVRTGDTLQIRSFANALEVGAIENISHFRAAFRESPYYGKILSEDGKTLAVRLRTQTRNRAVFRDEVFKAVEETVGNSQFSGAFLAGDAALKAEINRSVRSQLPMLLALGASVVAVFLYGFLRNGYRVAALMACLGVAVAQSLATVNMLGHSLTPVSLALPLLVSVIVIADGLHIFAIWDKETARKAASPLRSTMSGSWLPCLMTSLTSAVGFGAFSVSELVPVRNFGIDSFVAIALCYPLLIATVWGALALFPAGMSAKPGEKTARVTAAVLKGLAHRAKAPVVFGLASLILALSLFYAKTETNFLHVLFKKTSHVSKAFEVADRELGGSGSLEVLVDGGRERYFQLIDNFNRVKSLAEGFESEEFVNHSNTYILPVGITHRALAGGSASPLPQSADELAQEIFFLELSRGERGKDLVSPYLNFTSSTARIEAQTPNLSSLELGSLIDSLSSLSKQIFPGGEITVTGMGHYVHQLSRYVLSTQARSFALTLLVIAVVFTALFGLRLGMAGFVSNLFPVLVSTGMLCLLQVPFDFATVLVAGITFGLSVDDSIHFLHHFRRERPGASNTEEGIERSMRIVARPVVFTSLLFCAALAVFFSSSLVVMVKFALFTIAGLIAAMLSAILLLPSLVEIFRGDAPYSSSR